MLNTMDKTMAAARRITLALALAAAALNTGCWPTIPEFDANLTEGYLDPYEDGNGGYGWYSYEDESGGDGDGTPTLPISWSPPTPTVLPHPGPPFGPPQGGTGTDDPNGSAGHTMTIAAVTGPVECNTGDGWRLATVGDRLGPGDAVRTGLGGTAVMDCGTPGKATLEPGTRLAVLGVGDGGDGDGGAVRLGLAHGGLQIDATRPGAIRVEQLADGPVQPIGPLAWDHDRQNQEYAWRNLRQARMSGQPTGGGFAAGYTPPAGGAPQ